MNAAEAQKATEAAKQRIEKRRIAAIKEEERKEAERFELAKKEKLPEYRKEIKQHIKEAVEAGRVSTSYRIPWAKEPKLAQILVDELEKDGYEASWKTNHDPGDSDGYPASDSTDIEIFWGKEHERPRTRNSYW